MSAALFDRLSDFAAQTVREAFAGRGRGRTLYYLRDGVRIRVKGYPNRPHASQYGDRFGGVMAQQTEWYLEASALRRAGMVPPQPMDRLTMGGKEWRVVDADNAPCWRYAGGTETEIVVLTSRIGE